MSESLLESKVEHLLNDEEWLKTAIKHCQKHIVHPNLAIAVRQLAAEEVAKRQGEVH